MTAADAYHLENMEFHSTAIFNNEEPADLTADDIRYYLELCREDMMEAATVCSQSIAMQAFDRLRLALEHVTADEDRG